MRKVYVESPYGDSNPYRVMINVAYARAAIADCLRRGEAPFASHLLYTQPGVLRDDIAEQRRLGMDAGFVFAEMCDATVVYSDIGMTNGMWEGVDRAVQCGRIVEYRKMGDDWFSIAGGYWS